MKMTPAKWRARIQRSLELQKVRRDQAIRFMRAYAGDYNDKPKKDLDGNKDDASVNFVYSYVETVRPTILPGTPRAFVEAAEPEAEASELHFQAVINHFIRVLGVKAELKMVVQDWFFSFAAVFTGWDYREEPQYEKDGKTPIYEENEETGEPEEEDGEPVQAVTVLQDRPTYERLDPMDVVLDPDAKGPRKNDLWRARRITETWSQFCSRPSVTREVRRKVRPKALPRELWRNGLGDDSAAPSEKNWVVLWEIYDWENRCVKLLVDGESIDFFLEDQPWPYQMMAQDDPYPITILDAKWDYSSPYSFSSFLAYWGQIQERNRLRTIIQSTVRRSAPGWVAKKGAFASKEEKEKFVKAGIGELVEVNNPDSIKVRENPELSKEFFAHDAQVGDDTRNTSGLSEYDQNMADTATEASIQDQKSNIRKGEAKADFNDFCAITFSKMGQNCQQFLTEPMAVKIRKPRGPGELNWMAKDYDWHTVDGEKIQGDFFLKVEPGTDEQESEGLFRQQTLKGAEVLAPNPWVDQQKLAIKIARTFRWEKEDILKTPEQFQADQQAAAAAEAAKSGPKAQAGDESAEIKFSPIKVELLAPEVQAMIISAAMAQNGVPQILSGQGGKGAGVPPAGGPAAPASPSLAGPTPQNSVMPGGEVNQAPPPNDSANLPPATPVMPMSEMQGGNV